MINYGSLTSTQIANLEYSTNGGVKYTSVVPTIGNVDMMVFVRVKALGINPVSAPTILHFTEFVPGVDSSITVTLSTANLTTSSVLAACNITDLDGATGTCTLSG